MSYYAAGGYYQAGGLFKKLGKFVKKVAASPLASVAAQYTIGFVPGGSSALAAINTIRTAASSRGGLSAYAQSLPGTPATLASKPRVTRRRRRRSW